MPDLPHDIAALLRQGTVIPAHPLALDSRRRLDERRQRALSRYYVDAGDSGAGRGVNRNPERIAKAIETLREKWSDLDRRMRATEEFRAEEALWLIENGAFQEAVPIVVQLLKENPESPDGRALRVLQLIARGQIEPAKLVLEKIGDSVPKLDALKVKLEQVRARMATLH